MFTNLFLGFVISSRAKLIFIFLATDFHRCTRIIPKPMKSIIKNPSYIRVNPCQSVAKNSYTIILCDCLRRELGTSRSLQIYRNASDNEVERFVVPIRDVNR